ncbi:MAG: hypothetical protein ABSF67_02720 [Roseiarcus sp.]|jgi:hypothetical protein
MICALRRFAARLGLAAALALAATAAPATVATTPTTLSAGAWTDLGAGPMFLGLAYGWSAVYAIGDSPPSLAARGFPVPASGVNVFTPSHVWALAVGSPSSPPVVLTAPISPSAAINTDGGALAHVTNTPGSAGVDYSANKPTLPNVGANFGATGIYANYVLIAAVPANPSRNEIEVENTSGAQIVIILDDGTAASGAQPNNATIKAYAGGASAGAQGGSWSSQAFKGRAQVYAPSASAQVAVNAR